VNLDKYLILQAVTPRHSDSVKLIPLSDCPFVLNRLPVFLENLKKQGWRNSWTESV
jgi:hypothetical protein